MTTPTNRPTLGTILGRALRLRCPRCGHAKMFTGLLRMSTRCESCQLVFERDPGYFLGSAYINYGLTALSMTIAYVSLHFGAGIENSVLIAPLLVWVVLFPLFFFRYARALWLGMDLYFDRQAFEEDRPVHADPADG